MNSCIHKHNDKFGVDYNGVRMKLGLPIIKKGWQLDGTPFYHAPESYSLWFTDSRPEDKTHPYHAYKTIYYDKNDIVAEKDTYLNMDRKYYNGNPENSIILNDSIKKFISKCHALNIIYVYRCVKLNGDDFSKYSPGFNCEIIGEKGGYSHIEKLFLSEAEEILKYWDIKRLNY